MRQPSGLKDVFKEDESVYNLQTPVTKPSWWFNHWKNISQIGSFPDVGVKTTLFETTTEEHTDFDFGHFFQLSNLIEQDEPSFFVRQASSELIKLTTMTNL